MTSNSVTSRAAALRQRMVERVRRVVPWSREKREAYRQTVLDPEKNAALWNQCVAEHASVLHFPKRVEEDMGTLYWLPVCERGATVRWSTGDVSVYASWMHLGSARASGPLFFAHHLVDTQYALRKEDPQARIESVELTMTQVQQDAFLQRCAEAGLNTDFELTSPQREPSVEQYFVSAHHPPAGRAPGTIHEAMAAALAQHDDLLESAAGHVQMQASRRAPATSIRA